MTKENRMVQAFMFLIDEHSPRFIEGEHDFHDWVCIEEQIYAEKHNL
ncbi:hypothetical protein ES702_04924 [subsurface metagenome]